METGHGAQEGSLAAFHTHYIKYHGYISISMCIFGIISNLLNITILSRKSMRTAVNILLIAVACADSFLMTIHGVHVIHIYCLGYVDSHNGHKYGWALVALLHSFATTTIRFAAIGFLVTLAVFRYMHVRFATTAWKHVSIWRAKLSIFICCMVAIAVAIPSYISYEIRYVEFPNSTDGAYWLRWNEFAEASDWLLMKINIWLHSVVIRFTSILATAALSVALVHTMHKVQRNHKRLTGAANAKKKKKSKQASIRVTTMLVVIMSVFILTEAPHGIVLILSYTLGRDFFTNVYTKLHELFDVLVLFQCTVNFWFYCITSSHFRTEFKHFILRRNAPTASYLQTYALTSRAATHDPTTN